MRAQERGGAAVGRPGQQIKGAALLGARIGFGGVARGGHTMFRVDRSEGQALFGEYFNIFEGDGGDLRIEIANFGFTDIESAGSRHQSAREHFSAEEIAGAQQLIESYFSNPGVALETWRGVPDVKFLGDVRFRPDWIIPELSDD